MYAFCSSVTVSVELGRVYPLILSIPADGVGKSTIVTSLIKESFVAHVLPTSVFAFIPLTRSPGATRRSRGHNSTRGYSRECDDIYRRFRWWVTNRVHRIYSISLLAGPQDRQHLESEIRKAHVICVVYSIDNPNSFDRIPTFWLPHFRQLGVNVRLIPYMKSSTYPT